MDPFTIAPTLHGKVAHVWPMTSDVPLRSACGRKAWPQDISVNRTQPGRSPYLMDSMPPMCPVCFDVMLAARETLI